MDTIKQLIKQYMPVITVALLVLLVLAIGLLINNHIKHKQEQPVIVKQETAKNPKQFGNALHVSTKEAQQIITVKERSEPVVTYRVNAPTIHDAAVITKNAISNQSPNVPKAATEKSDRTAVVENDEAQKVDVYKINLDKPRSILAGATVMNNGEIYETIGYEDKRVQGLAHFKGTEFKGASALVKVVRW